MSERPQDDDTAALLDRVAAGNGAAFAELYRRWAPRAHAEALHHLGDAERAEAALQEGFLRVWHQAGSQPGGPDRAWLMTLFEAAIASYGDGPVACDFTREPVPPPARIWQGVALVTSGSRGGRDEDDGRRRRPGARMSGPTPATMPPFWRRPRVLAMVFAVGALIFVAGRYDRSPPAEPGEAHWYIHVDLAEHEITVRPDPALKGTGDSTLMLWLDPGAPEVLVPVGALWPDRETHLPATRAVARSLAKARRFVITRETGTAELIRQPTGPILFEGPLPPG
ncbi:sigma factor [Oceanibacterium hippocampi]|uniref:RNA polymerase sigma factor n=1 Tax=Oceanibacterium hippocampi TaxID=745714 RepID=A0A1Y5RKJ7_9PROT|nr:sigma factor [Oceanibacterium hippocampi]SLN19779.1 RNA polymerase sigma factor [Oceanibacterium hippocampi]